MNVACLMQNEYSSEIMWPFFFFFASSISENCWYERLEGLAENCFEIHLPTIMSQELIVNSQNITRLSFNSPQKPN